MVCLADNSQVVTSCLMIALYSGTPGSGKSCHQAEDIREWSGYRNMVVIANFNINMKYLRPSKSFIFECWENDEITPERLMAFSKKYFETHRFKEGMIKLYLDECQLMFNAREWEGEQRKAWIKFFTQHRKYGYDVYLIAQFDRMIDRQLRSLIEYEYIHRRLSNFGWKGAILSLLTGGQTYVAVKIWYPLHQKIGSEIHHIRKKYYRLYDSYKSFKELEEPKKEELIINGQNTKDSRPPESTSQGDEVAEIATRKAEEADETEPEFNKEEDEQVIKWFQKLTQA